MDTNKNSYTIIYATLLVTFVAAVLAFASLSLKDKQQKNIDVEKQLSLLGALGLGQDAGTAPDKNIYVEGEFSKYINKGIVVNGKGETISEAENTPSSMGAVVGGTAFKINMKGQYDQMVRIASAPADQVEEMKAKLELPVFMCTLASGETVYMLSCYGAGLWGPIWGYIALRGDFNTISGIVFAHKGETPGLGAEIATPMFCDQFKGKEIFANGQLASIIIAKGGATPGSLHEVDAISGGTITCKALENTIRMWLDSYLPYINKMKELAATPMPLDAAMPSDSTGNAIPVAADSTNLTK